MRKKSSIVNGQNGLFLAGTCTLSRFLLRKHPKQWATKCCNLKRNDSHINFLKWDCDFDFFRTSAGFTAGVVFPKVNHISDHGICEYCVISTFLRNFLTDIWRHFSKSVNHVSDQGFKCLSGSVMSTDKSDCVAKFKASLSCNFVFTELCISTLNLLLSESAMILKLQK